MESDHLQLKQWYHSVVNLHHLARQALDAALCYAEEDDTAASRVALNQCNEKMEEVSSKLKEAWDSFAD